MFLCFVRGRCGRSSSSWAVFRTKDVQESDPDRILQSLLRRLWFCYSFPGIRLSCFLSISITYPLGSKITNRTSIPRCKYSSKVTTGP